MQSSQVCSMFRLSPATVRNSRLAARLLQHEAIENRSILFFKLPGHFPINSVLKTETLFREKKTKQKICYIFIFLNNLFAQ
jgi:hypothetical protein